MSELEPPKPPAKMDKATMQNSDAKQAEYAAYARQVQRYEQDKQRAADQALTPEERQAKYAQQRRALTYEESEARQAAFIKAIKR